MKSCLLQTAIIWAFVTLSHKFLNDMLQFHKYFYYRSFSNQRRIQLDRCEGHDFDPTALFYRLNNESWLFILSKPIYPLDGLHHTQRN